MKLNVILILILLGGGNFRVEAEESYRTDINPALLYWQGYGEMPSLSEAEHAYLFAGQWQGQPADEAFNLAMSKYDLAFKFFRRAAKARVDCDWGIDLTDGPLALLPGLAKWKHAAQVARLRVQWHLQRGEQAAARDDLLAAFVLGRNAAKDGILISTLVQIAIENIMIGTIAENYHLFSRQTLEEIGQGIATAPARTTVAQCIRAERYSFPDWIIRNVQQLQAAGASEGAIINATRELLKRALSDASSNDLTMADKVIEAAGATPAGLMEYARQLHGLYDEAEELMALPYSAFAERMPKFNEKINNHPNLMVHMFFAVFEKCRAKEFGVEISLAMLRAGIEHRTRGPAALEAVKDPVLGMPFAFRRLQVGGADRGFELRSKFDGRGFEEVLVFIEKAGPPIQVIGKNAGKEAK